MKTVLMPINVPSTEYCYDGAICCDQFEIEGAEGRCAYDILGIRKIKPDVYLKPDECLHFDEENN